MTDFFDIFLVSVLAGGVRAGVPLFIAALGETFVERSGIINLGLEGIMLMGALVAVIAAYHTGSPVIGLLMASVTGSILALIHGILCIRFLANQMVSGIAMIIFGTGLSAFIGINYVGKKIVGITPFKLPLLGDIPIIGPIFFNHDFIVYLAYLLIPISWILMYKTHWGIKIRAVGEDPEASFGSGLNVNKIRMLTVLSGGFLAGLSGAYLSIVYTQLWMENMVAGRGLIALALVIFSSWNPIKAALGAFLFGTISALQLRLQAIGIDFSPYLLSMLPYILTIAVLVYSTPRINQRNIGIPKALGKAFIMQK